jgi:hypothetical protein
MSYRDVVRAAAGLRSDEIRESTNAARMQKNAFTERVKKRPNN